MENRIAIIGIGLTPLRSVSPEVSFREMTFEAATRAYADAGVVPREIDTFVTVAEDFHEGTSITDEYTPDQLGAVRRPMQTIAGDGLQGLATAYMLIRSGLAETAVVEAHSKASNIVHHEQILALAFDPTFERPRRFNPHAVAGMEMRRYLHEAGVAPEVTARIVSTNRRAALANPYAAYGAEIGVDDVLASPPLAEPLRDLEVSRYADGAVVLVLASAEWITDRSATPVWIRGISWATDEPSLSGRPWGTAAYARIACEAAYAQAGIRSAAGEIDLFEVDDTYAYKELQHLEAALGLKIGEGARLTESGPTAGGRHLRVNASGGNLGMGYGYDASALFRTAITAHQLRGTAGTGQLKDLRTALVLSWRGVPTTTGGAVVLAAS
jgi:acetyl-CoA C-acetyltransferase